LSQYLFRCGGLEPNLQYLCTLMRMMAPPLPRPPQPSSRSSGAEARPRAISLVGAPKLRWPDRLAGLGYLRQKGKSVSELGDKGQPQVLFLAARLGSVAPLECGWAAASPLPPRPTVCPRLPQPHRTAPGAPPEVKPVRTKVLFASGALLTPTILSFPTSPFLETQ